jgi:hypothetical protein
LGNYLGHLKFVVEVVKKARDRGFAYQSLLGRLLYQRFSAKAAEAGLRSVFSSTVITIHGVVLLF